MKNKASKIEIFEKVPVGKAILTMGLPTIISQLINLIYNVADTIFIGQTGNPFMVSAITVSSTIFLLTPAFGNLYGIGGGSLIARLIGRKENEEVKKVSCFSFYGAIGISLFYSLLILCVFNPLLELLGASTNTLEYARQYVLLTCIIGTLPNVLSLVMAHLLRNYGYSNIASIGLSTGGLLNIALDPLFMFVLFPSGNEVIGAGLATLISNIIVFLIFIIAFIKLSKNNLISLNPKYLRQIRRKDIKELYSVGVPSAILNAMFDIGNVVLNKLASTHGDLELAAIGISLRAERLPNAINIGLCQGMQPIVAYNYSSGNEQRKNETIKKGRLYGIIVSLVSIVLFILFRKPLCELFLNTKSGDIESSLKTIQFATSYIVIRCFASPFQFLNFHSSYCLQGMGDGKDTLIHAIIRIAALYIPTMLIMNKLFGMIGLVASLPISEFISDFIALFLLHKFQKANHKD